MSIKHIQTLVNDPHFSSMLLQSFLSGYGTNCDLQIAMLTLPLLYNGEIRKKLLTANKNSSPQTLFLYAQHGKELSGQSKLAGFWNKFNILETLIKQSIIVLYSEKKIEIDGNKIKLLDALSYKDFNGNVQNWLRSAHYLGVILKKATTEDLLVILRS